MRKSNNEENNGQKQDNLDGMFEEYFIMKCKIYVCMWSTNIHLQIKDRNGIFRKNLSLKIRHMMSLI